MRRREEKTEVNKKDRRRKWIIRVVVLACVAVYAGIVFGSQQPMIESSAEKTKELTERVEELEQQKALLERQQMYVGSEQYTENMARDKLKWVKEDEILFRDKNEENASPSPSPSVDVLTEDESR